MNSLWSAAAWTLLACAGREFTERRGGGESGEGGTAGSAGVGGGGGGSSARGGMSGAASGGGGTAAAGAGAGRDEPGGAGGEPSDAGASGSGASAGSGSVDCEAGTFVCGNVCVENAGCSTGTGSCQNNGVRLCLPGGTVGCSVEPKPTICVPEEPSGCDPCGSGSAVPGSRLCDGDGCAFGACTAGSGRFVEEYAPAWNNPCGWDHDGSGQNWRCETDPLTAPSCTCAERALRLPAGTYRFTVTAGFPPTDTPMTLGVVSGNTPVAAETFTVAGLVLTTYALSFSLGACTDVRLEISRTSSAAGFVVNRIILERI